ncbi:MAG: vitamin K epoxide reductase family protein [Solirubrobacteraceae bacterium]
MSNKLRRAMLVVTVLGIALAIYLVYVHYSGTQPACTAGQACLKVQTSQWSKLAGVPVALIGLIGYISILASLLVADREQSRLATLALTVIGFGFSGYLTYRELFSIHAICEECAASAVFLTILFVCAAIRYVTTVDPASPDPDASAAGDAGDLPPTRSRATATRA